VKVKVKVKPIAIMEYMARENLSKNAFSKRTRIHSLTLNKLLSEDYMPSPKLRRRLMEHTGLRFDDLFTIIT